MAVVATPMIARRGIGAWLAAALAVGYLVVMFVAGRPPEYGHFNEFEAAGPLREVPTAVTRVMLGKAERRWELRRDGGRWRLGTAALAPGVAARLDDGLRFLHASPPVRMLDATPDDAAYGLSAGVRIVLANDSGILLDGVLGRRAPDGILRYARFAGRDGVALMSGFVGDAWDAVVDGLPVPAGR